MNTDAQVVSTDRGQETGQIWTVAGATDGTYTYEEAINIAGNGFYNIALLATLSIATLAMGVDIFGFSVVVTGATCDFNLALWQTNILLSVTFIGPIVMAYPWGYISDTQGRKKSMLIALWASFIVSVIGVFSPNWITMAVLKLISTSFSSCAQSATYTLLGESCTQGVRDAYMLIMTSVLDFCLAAYVVVAYFILNLDFEYNLGYVTFTPWRLLALILALPLSMGAFGLIFFYESPKFLLNKNKHEKALEYLFGIWKINGGRGEYPVKLVLLNEDGNERPKDLALWQSLWEQIMPLFRPPLLSRTLQLYTLTALVYGTNNSFFIWFPFLVEKFVKVFKSNATGQYCGICDMIVSDYNNNTSDVNNVVCNSGMDITLVWSSLSQGLSFVFLLICIARVANKKKVLIITLLAISGFSCVGAVLIKEKFTSLIMFFGILLNELVIGIFYSYYVDLYPTSIRGMAACIATMVARTSALGGVSLLGEFITSHCVYTFYICGVLMFCGVLLALLLPPDIKENKLKD